MTHYDAVILFLLILRLLNTSKVVKLLRWFKFSMVMAGLFIIWDYKREPPKANTTLGKSDY